MARESQWATFVRNHDELTLDKLSDEERQEVFAAFGPEEDMQIYGRGLRRRLPPMLDGDPRRLRMVYSLLFSLPGTPVLFYGEEIGMGENLAAEGRMAVRTPMQWTAGRNGGFSTAPPSRLPGPVVEGGFGPEHVNVRGPAPRPGLAAVVHDAADPRYRACPELGWGEFEVLDQPRAGGARPPLDLGRRVDGRGAQPVGASRRHVSLQLEGCDEETRLVDLLVDGITHAGRPRPASSSPLEGYGYRWLRVVQPGGKLLA